MKAEDLDQPVKQGRGVMVSDGANDAMPSQIGTNIVEVRRWPSKATRGMNELYRIGQINIDVSVFRFHAAIHEE